MKKKTEDAPIFSRRERFGFFCRIARKFRFQLFFLFIIMGCAWGAGVLAPLLQKDLIDALGSRSVPQTVLFGILTVEALALSRGGGILQALLASALHVKVSAALKEHFFRHLLEIPLGVAERTGSGYLGQRVHVDIEWTTNFFAGGLFTLIFNLFKIIAALILLFVVCPAAAAAAIPVLILSAGITWSFRQKQYLLSREISEAAADFRRVTQNSLDHIQLCKTQADEGAASGKIASHLKKETKLRLMRIRWERFFSFLLQLVPAVLVLSFAVWGCRKILNGQWSLGALWAMISYLAMLAMPTRAFCSGLFHKKECDAAVDRLLELEKLLPEDRGGSQEEITQGKIEFDRICFAYPGGRELFNGLSLVVTQGEHLGISGASGSGKSTLGALLLRLYDVSSGEIRLDGMPLKARDLHVLRRSIGYIGQEPELFYGTIRENLDRRHCCSDQELLTAIEKVGLTSRLAAEPEGLDALIQEGAVNFSAGEKLRLALARELLRSAPILLLDEATANLDGTAEARVFELLKVQWAHKSVIFISHRPFPAGAMDRTVSLTVVR